MLIPIGVNILCRKERDLAIPDEGMELQFDASCLSAFVAEYGAIIVLSQPLSLRTRSSSTVKYAATPTHFLQCQPS